MNLTTTKGIAALLSRSLTTPLQYNFASKMQASSTDNNKDSAGRRLGVKKFGGQEVFPGDIVARQRGFKWHPGKNTYWGKDHTIHAKCEGIVRFEKDPYRKRKLYYIHVEPKELRNREARPPPPYQYHPELFPELAKSNPPPAQLKVPKPRVEQEKKKWSIGQVVTQLKYRTDIAVPEHYNGPELSTDPLIAQIDAKLNDLGMKYMPDIFSEFQKTEGKEEAGQPKKIAEAAGGK